MDAMVNIVLNWQKQWLVWDNNGWLLMKRQQTYLSGMRGAEGSLRSKGGMRGECEGNERGMRGAEGSLR